MSDKSISPLSIRCLALLVIGAVTRLGSAEAAEIIGPYTIVATPTAASVVGGSLSSWLNVVNAPVSVNDAFTGFGLVDDGYADAASGTTLLLTFAPGTLVNQPGPDLVLFDADDNLNVYLVSTSADGFAHPIAAAATTNTGVTRNYFLGGAGPSNYAVFATTIDLSSYGIPNGQSVSQVQLFTEGPSDDPLGLGVLAHSTQVPIGPWIPPVAFIVVAIGWSVHRRRQALSS